VAKLKLAAAIRRHIRTLFAFADGLDARFANLVKGRQRQIVLIGSQRLLPA